jgi:hypothetical protein
MALAIGVELEAKSKYEVRYIWKYLSYSGNQAVLSKQPSWCDNELVSVVAVALSSTNG